jgi:hypothetical protein
MADRTLSAEAWTLLRFGAHVGEVETGPGGDAVGFAVADAVAEFLPHD